MNIKPKAVLVSSEQAMIEFGEYVFSLLRADDLVFLVGDLGAGKTTLTRGILRKFGHVGPVPSPTYTLVEPYNVSDRELIHMDLYRLKSPEELEMLGFRDFVGNTICIIEWPERGGSLLPPPNVIITIETVDDGRSVAIERC
jgi:tRNA threonylcarbamoyladenosine biosynthesis protein TsaE